MRLFTILASLAVVADVAVSSSWFSKAGVYSHCPSCQSSSFSITDLA